MKALCIAVLAVILAAAAQGRNRDDPADDNYRANVTAEYLARDFAPLLLPKSEFIGYIGEDFQRLKIHFSSVTKDPANSAIYRITGTSEAKGKSCTLEGVISVTALKQAANMHYGVDDEFKNKGLKLEGTLFGHYEINEIGPVAICGAFRGNMQLDWYVDRKNTLHYDDIESYSDGYTNNQYEGSWTSVSGKTKTANWGEYRIPNSRDLDCGAAEFAPCEEYRDKGWAGYQPQKWTP